MVPAPHCPFMPALQSLIKWKRWQREEALSLQSHTTLEESIETVSASTLNQKSITYRGWEADAFSRIHLL
jgi:hypothetical protein